MEEILPNRQTEDLNLIPNTAKQKHSMLTIMLGGHLIASKEEKKNFLTKDCYTSGKVTHLGIYAEWIPSILNVNSCKLFGLKTFGYNRMQVIE